MERLAPVFDEGPGLLARSVGALVARETDSGAQKRTRTSTTLRSLRPERSASTNSAIWADHWAFHPAGGLS